MRTLRKHLDLPTVSDAGADETAFAMYLPRRSTRLLFRILALIAGIAAGLYYARWVLTDIGPWWTVALASTGAILGYVVVLMPGAFVHYGRKLSVRLALGVHGRRLRRAISAIRRRAEQALEEREDDVEAWEALGVTSLLSGETQRAAMAFERACQHGENGGGQVNLSVALAETQDVSAAADLLLRSSQDAAMADAARHNIGVLMSHRPSPGIVERIIEDLDRLRVPAVLSSLGAWEIQHGDLEMAEHYFKAAIEEDPGAVAARANLALVSYHRGDLAGAVEQLHEASTLDPTDPTILNSLGALICAGGRPMVAARILSRAAMLAPGSTAVEFNRGAARLAMGQFRDALDSFTEPRVRAAWPVDAAHNSALALIGLDRIEAAREELERGLEHDPDDPDLLNNLGCLEWLEGEEEDALEYFARVDVGTEHRAIALNLAAFKISQGRTDEALKHLDEMKKGGQEPAIAFLKGVALLMNALREYRPNMSRRQRRRFFEAMHLCVRPFNAVADSENTSAEAQANLALYRYLRLEFNEAVELFRRSAEEFPRDGFLQFCIGTALAERAAQVQQEHSPNDSELVGRAREDLRRARRHLEKAAALGEIHADVFCNLGMCAYDLGDIEGALNAFKRMSTLEDSADAANNLAIVHAREGQQLQRRARAASLVSQQREQKMLEQAKTHISTALHYFQNALKHTPRDPVLHGNTGLAYMLRNRGSDVEAALRHWQRMLALGGKQMGRRYEELAALAHSGEGERAEFDEALMEFRSLDPRRCLMTLPPRLSGPRYALQPIVEEDEWRLISDDPQVREVLRRRERLAALRKRLARLSL